MWDRLRQRDGGAPLSRKKLEAWQDAHSPSQTTPSGRGVRGGNNQYQYMVRGGPAPQRPPRELDLGDAPPREAQRQSYLGPQPAHHNHHHQQQPPRPVSSIYSQPSPDAAVFAAQQLRNEIARNDPLEISPPSSPDIASPKEPPNAGDVSPIDEAADASHLPSERHAHAPPPRQPRSNIPMMRRERRKNSNAAAVQSLHERRSQDQLKQPRPYNHDVRWDPRTGEPTTGPKGRPSQVNPQQFVQGLRAVDQSPPQHQRPSQSSSPANAFRDRLRPVRQSSASPQPEPSPAPASRPEWRGASGRTALVAPVKDNKTVPPLRIPPRTSNQRASSRMSTNLSPVESFGSGSLPSPVAATRNAPPTSVNTDVNVAAPGAMASPSQQPQRDNYARNPQSRSMSSTYPTPPSDRPSAATTYSPVQESPGAMPAQPPPLHIPSNEKAIRRKPTRPLDDRAETPTAPSENSPREASVAQSHARDASSEWVQPPSRFSITTYATSHHTSTPRASSDGVVPPLPTPPMVDTPTPTPSPRPAPLSILERGRPIVSGYENSPRPSPTEEPVRIMLDSPYYVASPTTGSSTLKPRPATKTNVLPVPEGNFSTLSLMSNSSGDKGKSLPPAPPETLATDRVTELNAAHQALANRRINLNKAIRQMTEMMPTDNILASDAVRRKRELEKQKVDNLRQELADVDRQSYEIGLKLHRAYKRIDREAEYEPTTLWVRRVTN